MTESLLGKPAHVPHLHPESPDGLFSMVIVAHTSRYDVVQWFPLTSTLVDLIASRGGEFRESDVPRDTPTWAHILALPIHENAETPLWCEPWVSFVTRCATEGPCPVPMLPAEWQRVRETVAAAWNGAPA